MTNDKQCKKCLEIKTYADFYRDKSTSSGLSRICKQCDSKKTIAYHKKNRATLNENRKIYIENNKDHINETTRLYRKENREKIKEIEDRYRKANREKVNEWANNRYKKNPEKYRTLARLNYANYPTGVVKQFFRINGRVMNNVPNELIETKRIILLIKRELKK